MSLAETDDNEWKTERQKRREGMADLVAQLPPDTGREFDTDDMLAFFEAIAEGYGAFETGISLGWTPAMIDRFVKEPSRAELLNMLNEAQKDGAERAIYRGVLAHNSTCIKLYAYTKMADRGYVERQQIVHSGQTQHEIVISVRQAMEEQTRAMIEAGGVDAIGAMQSAFLDAIDAEVIDDE